MTAKEIRAYVNDPAKWTDEMWEKLHAEGLADRRVARDQKSHKWVLTDKGLDLYIEGK